MKTWRFSISVSALAVSILLSGCGKSPVPILDNTCIVGSFDIYGGKPVHARRWSSTVALTEEINGHHRQFCSGVLVARDVVVTAAHCLNPFFSPFSDKIRIYVGNGEAGGKYRGQYKVKTARAHPGFSFENNVPFDRYDFAYLILEDKVNITDISLTPVLRNPRETGEALFIGNEVDIVGFGYTEDSITGIKHEVHTVITEITETEIVLGGDGRDSCRGDSGGPVYITLGNGETRILGITSRGDLCGEGGIYGKINVAIDWIEKEEPDRQFTFKSRHLLCNP